MKHLNLKRWHILALTVMTMLTAACNGQGALNDQRVRDQNVSIADALQQVGSPAITNW